MEYKDLVEEAFKAREFAYTPYSNFNVGAALLTADDHVIHGCNIESASQTPSCCAERTAFFKGVSSGHKDFKAIAIVAAPKGTEDANFDYCAPCGVCRQIMAEFCELDTFDVVLAKSVEEFRVYKLTELLPLAFTGKDI
ncbi:MAG: cytidine deaminase [Erysipelothrix sp.]|nr:cytidine deaminase [Erysipelothrix sp.]